MEVGEDGRRAIIDGLTQPFRRLVHALAREYSYFPSAQEIEQAAGLVISSTLESNLHATFEALDHTPPELPSTDDIQVIPVCVSCGFARHGLPGRISSMDDLGDVLDAFLSSVLQNDSVGSIGESQARMQIRVDEDDIYTVLVGVVGCSCYYSDAINAELVDRFRAALPAAARCQALKISAKMSIAAEKVAGFQGQLVHELTPDEMEQAKADALVDLASRSRSNRE
jgi:hypothetical protein